MRVRTFSALGVGAAALTLVAALTPVASAEAQGSHPTTHPTSSATYCFKNLKRADLTGASIPSENFDDVNSKFDSQAADDFTLTQPCLIKAVDVFGSFTQQSNLDWETVYIYPDAGGKPGFPAIWVQSALNGKQGKELGDFRIKFGPLMLQPGTYWISVQAQLQKGAWGWDNTSTGVGSVAVFQNPDQGFPGCPTWTAIQTCFAGTPGPDLAFALRGTPS